MDIKKDQPSGSVVTLTVTVSHAELKPFLEKAAQQISAEKTIAGFRPGKAPYEIVAQQVGEMTIYQRCVDDAITKTLFAALEKELADTQVVGQPRVDIDKLAPDNDLVYTATVTLLPEVTVGDISKIKVEKKDVATDQKAVEQTLEQLQQSRVQEEPKDDAAATGDKVSLDFDVFVDKVAIEGGSAKEYPLVIGEHKFIPGFEEQIVGMKQGEEKEFELRFPKDYHQKNLANKLATFKVSVRRVFTRILPELNDDFAKQLGAESFAKLTETIEGNIKAEAEQKEAQRQEIAMLDALAAQATFSDIPQTLIDTEAHRMVHELEASINQQGLQFKDYLEHLKKTEADLQKDFAEDAQKRVKTALIIRQVAEDNNITVPTADIDAEINRAAETYKDNKEALENIKSESSRRYLENTLLNRKVITFLKEKILK